MKFKHYLNRVKESSEFKKFKKEHKNAFLCAGFFVLDFETKKHLHQVDFFIPTNKKIATFLLDKGVSIKVSESFEGKPAGKDFKKLEELKGESKIDLDILKGIVEDEMHNRTIPQKIKKIIAVLISKKGKKIWNLNCITNGMDILKVHIDDEDSSILEFEKFSLTDIMRKA